MSKIAVVGAGKTGRGFIGRLLAESEKPFELIDKNETLIAELNASGSYTVNFFGDRRAPIHVKGYTAHTWKDARVDEADLIFVSVCGPNLADVGMELAGRLRTGRTYHIITCENASDPAEKLRAAIGREDIFVSEATVFCTTVEQGTGTDINSEDYPYLQCNAALLGGYVPDVAGVRPVENFGNLLTRKLFTYNAASCIIAYLGWLFGYSDYGEAANNPRILELLDRNYAVTNRVLCQEFGYTEEDQAEFAALSKKKFCDRTITDTIARNAREPQRKLGAAERVIGPMSMIARYGEDTSVLEMTAAAMLLYDAPGEDAWRAVRTEKSPMEILRDFGGLDEASRLTSNILSYYHAFSAIVGGNRI